MCRASLQRADRRANLRGLPRGRPFPNPLLASAVRRASLAFTLLLQGGARGVTGILKEILLRRDGDEEGGTLNSLEVETGDGQVWPRIHPAEALQPDLVPLAGA